jgi:PTH1 family peptidyl-tRNA hydrolase
MLIVGLGNIGFQYRNTYHYMGFMVADKLSEMLKIDFAHRIGKAKVAFTKDKEFIIAKPETYMNLSGESVRALLKYFNLKVKDLIVVFDDIDIEKGKIRVRDNGSAGTHNGMRNILLEIPDPNFIRVRIGTKRTSPDGELKDYVLSRVSYDDREVLLPVIDKAAQAIYNYLQDKDLEKLKREVSS